MLIRICNSQDARGITRANRRQGALFGKFIEETNQVSILSKIYCLRLLTECTILSINMRFKETCIAINLHSW